MVLDYATGCNDTYQYCMHDWWYSEEYNVVLSYKEELNFRNISIIWPPMCYIAESQKCSDKWIYLVHWFTCTPLLNYILKNLHYSYMTYNCDKNTEIEWSPLLLTMTGSDNWYSDSYLRSYCIHLLWCCKNVDTHFMSSHVWPTTRHWFVYQLWWYVLLHMNYSNIDYSHLPSYRTIDAMFWSTAYVHVRLEAWVFILIIHL